MSPRPTARDTKSHKVFSIRISTDLAAAIDAAAMAHNESPSGLARRWIEEGLMRQAPTENIAQQRLTTAIAGLRGVNNQLAGLAAMASDVLRVAQGK